MNKKIFISLGSLIVLVVAYWLISPLWNNMILNEELPGVIPMTINDNFETMDIETKAKFEKQTMEMKDKMMNKNESMPVSGPKVIGQANLVPRAHEVKGSALFVKSNNETYLRFENLKTINGPDLRIYLGAALNADDVVDLGPIRATEGSVNYLIPKDTDLSKYKNVMIWCRAFGVLFSYAQL